MSKIILLAFALFACVSHAEEPPGPPTPELTAAYQHDADLACELHRALAKGRPAENVFFSSASITSALAMLCEGARGETQAELFSVLQGTEEPSLADLRALRADLHHRLSAASGNILWRDANAIWFDDQATLVKATYEALREHHHAYIKPADFRGHADQAREEINAWVEKKTEDRIKDLLPSSSVSATTRMVLVNAVYFLGKWEEEFEKKATEDRPFQKADGTETKVPFLRDRRALPVAFFNAADESQPTSDSAQLTAFEIPYRGGQLSFVGLIPADETGLPALENRMNSALLTQWLGALQKREVDFAMPKLDLNPSYDLRPVLLSLGLGRVLDPATADLGEFFEDGGDGLSITGAFHKSFLKVDEKGTEAAAATGLVVASVAAPAPRPVIHADRPYLFLIRERSTGAVLFMGRITNP